MTERKFFKLLPDTGFNLGTAAKSYSHPNYHSAKYILFPNSELDIHNPDNPKGPLYHYLVKCSATKAGVIDGREVEVRSFDFRTNRFQRVEELVVIGRKTWGNRGKPILKYLFLRYRQMLFE